MIDTTVVITSCGRHDLLAKTLASFRAFNTDLYTGDVVVVEDGDADPTEICEQYGAKIIRVGRRSGQINAIDLAYKKVNTPYIFHCEDDWEFYRPGFIERSRQVLTADPSTVCIWLRAWNDTNAHPFSFECPSKTFAVLAHDYLTHGAMSWHGFTFNPGLRRLSDYNRVAPFSSVEDIPNFNPEASIGHRYKQLGYRAVILDETGYVRHLGFQRHIV